jgi:single-stranded-DNA-specific exonuclease RecJ
MAAWIKNTVDKKQARAIAEAYSCDMLTAYILVSRGLTSDEQLRCFFTDDDNLLHDPFLLPGITEAIQRIRLAREGKEKILIFGDRDVDGITGTTLLADYLQGLGIAVSWRIPVGDEPYGLSMQAVESFSEEKGNLIITVDCGISCIAETARAAELGIDVIVTDHHIPKDILPEAVTVVNPKLPCSSYPFPDLAGCMIAFKLVLALQTALGDEGLPDFIQKETGYIQLAALGTVADIVTLQNENRLIVRRGLQAMKEKPRHGLSELLVTLGLAGKRITSKELAWLACPAINAAGRMGCPDKALNLFMETDPLIRIDLAREIRNMNERRKRLGTKTWPVVELLAGESIARFDGKLAVAAGENISRGITGIMANRMTERFHIPAMAVHLGVELAIGSIRSPGNYDIRLLLEPIDDILQNWGGHKNALGFSLQRSLWEQFIDRLEIEICNIVSVDTQDHEPLAIDAELPHSYIAPDIFSIVDRFEPYGTGNEPLVFVSSGLKIIASALMGKNDPKHLKITVDTGKYQWPAVLWNSAGNIGTEVTAGDTVDMAYSFNRDSWRRADTPQLLIRDMRKSVI